MLQVRLEAGAQEAAQRGQLHAARHAVHDEHVTVPQRHPAPRHAVALCAHGSSLLLDKQQEWGLPFMWLGAGSAHPFLQDATRVMSTGAQHAILSRTHAGCSV